MFCIDYKKVVFVTFSIGSSLYTITTVIKILLIFQSTKILDCFDLILWLRFGGLLLSTILYFIFLSTTFPNSSSLF